MSEALPPTEEFSLEGASGEPIELPIALGPATGYAWRLELPEGVERIEDGPERQVDPAHRMGGAVGGNLRVVARSGQHTILARLARPWAPDEAVRVVTIRLHVG